MLLERAVCLITGGARGIGLAIAERFAADGATVVIADKDASSVAAAAGARGPSVEGVACDVTDEHDVAALVDGVVGRHGRLDVLVNNAGITRDAMVHRMSLDAFRQVIDVHLQGSWLCSRAALAHMRSREEGGVIINMSSIAGKSGNLGQTNYSAAKAGMIGMTKALALEGARFGVRVNAIQPGLIATEMTRSMPAGVWEDKLVGIPLGRAGEPDEVAKVALFLACDLSSYVTGTTIEVAGGRHM